MPLRLFLLCCLISITPLIAQTTQPTDLFTAGSVWTGTEVGDARRPNTTQAGSRPASFKVSDRNGASFTADCTIAGSTVELRGQVDSKGNIHAQAVKVVRGTGWDPNILDLQWTGGVNGDQMTFGYTNSHNLSRSINMTIDHNGSGERKKKKS